MKHWTVKDRGFLRTLRRIDEHGRIIAEVRGSTREDDDDGWFLSDERGVKAKRLGRYCSELEATKAFEEELKAESDEFNPLAKETFREMNEEKVAIDELLCVARKAADLAPFHIAARLRMAIDRLESLR